MSHSVTYTRMDGAEAVQRLSALRELYGIVFAEPPYNEGPEMVEKFDSWIQLETATKSGFDLMAAWDGEQLAGIAYGYTMPAGEWWHRTDRAAPEDVKASEKFAVMEWAVLPDYRGRGIGRQLMDKLLAGRSEPWATLCVNPAANARRVYESFGWEHIANTKPGRMPGMDVMVCQLR